MGGNCRHPPEAAVNDWPWSDATTIGIPKSCGITKAEAKIPGISWRTARKNAALPGYSEAILEKEVDRKNKYSGSKRYARPGRDFVAVYTQPEFRTAPAFFC